MSTLAIIAVVAFLAWIYLNELRGGYWRGEERLDHKRAPLDEWPAVVAIVPARNEADVIAQAVGSILAQDYPGNLHLIVVDDHSDDGTAEAARAAGDSRLTVLTAKALEPGWVGKLWALNQGVSQAGAAPYLWFTDADIAHEKDTLRRLVTTAVHDKRALVSLMVKLWCQSFWEKLLIPPFVYFFQMLFPFAWANDDNRRTAAAAGGCVLVKAARLQEAGGLAAMKGAIIDDCTLAALIKPLARRHGEGIHVALTERSRSLRPYQGLGEIWRMVARSAFTQLRYSPLFLLGTLVGMALLYLAPPLLALSWPLHEDRLAALLGFCGWWLMGTTLRPTLKLYDLPQLWGATLPLAGLLYSAMTVSSALAHWRGKGATWKGRIGAGRVSP